MAYCQDTVVRNNYYGSAENESNEMKNNLYVCVYTRCYRLFLFNLFHCRVKHRCTLPASTIYIYMCKNLERIFHLLRVG